MLYQPPPGTILLPARRNDNPCDKIVDGRHYINWRDGFTSGPIDYRGEYRPELTEDSLRRCSWFVITPEQYDHIQQMLVPQIVGDEALPFLDANNRILPTPLALDYASLTQANVKDVDGLIRNVEADARNHALTKPLDLTRFGLTPFIDIRKQTFAIVDPTDELAISSGTPTVGTAGTYPTHGGAGGLYADVAAALTGNLISSMISAITETATATSTTSLAGHTWNTSSDTPHYGDPTAGWLLTANFQGRLFWWQQDNAGTMEIGHIRATHVGTVFNANLFVNSGNGVITVASGTQYDIVHDILYDGNQRAQSGINLQNNPVTVSVYNNVMWALNYASGGAGAAYRNVATSGPVTVENNAVYMPVADIYIFGFDAVNTAGLYRNNTAYGFSGLGFGRGGGATGRYNRSDDLSADNANWLVGVGNTTGAVVGNDVQSVDDTQATFFDIVVSGPLDGTGEANGIAARTSCMRNRAVPGPSGTSVGPAESPPSSSSVSSSSGSSSSQSSTSSSSQSSVSSASSTSSTSSSSRSVLFSASSSSTSTSSPSTSSTSSESSFSTGGEAVNSAITQDILDALKQIRKPTYNYDVAMVEQQRRLLQMNARWEFILVMENEPAELDHLYLRQKEYAIWFFPAQADELTGDAVADQDSEISYYDRNAIADITKALMVDPYRKEYALDTEIIPGTHDIYTDGDATLFGTWCLCRVTTNIDLQNQIALR